MSGSSCTLPLITVVLICSLMPASLIARIAGRVSSKCPGMPRMPSCVCGARPVERERDGLDARTTAIRAIDSGVSIGVTDGDRQTGHAELGRVGDELEDVVAQQAVATGEHEDRVGPAEPGHLVDEVEALGVVELARAAARRWPRHGSGGTRAGTTG